MNEALLFGHLPGRERVSPVIFSGGNGSPPVISQDGGKSSAGGHHGPFGTRFWITR
jgi:hypothetical protein